MSYDEDIEKWTREINYNPKNVDAYNNRGIAYGNKGDYDNANADFTRAKELDS